MTHFGRQVAQHREDRGWSQAELSRVSGVSRSQIVRIEGGTGGCSLDSAQWLDTALGADGKIVDGWRADTATRRQGEIDPVKRRTVLGAMTGLAFSATTPDVALEALRHGLSHAADTDVAGWHAIARDYAHDFYTTTPVDLLGQLRRDLAVLQHWLTPDDADLLRVAGQLSAIMAITLASLGQLVVARRWWRDARGYADRSRDLDTRIWVRDWEVVDGTYERRPIPEILDLADHTVALAGERVCCGTAGVMSGRAQALAVAGDTEGAVAALQATETLTERMPAAIAADADSMFGWPRVRYEHTASYVYTHIGETARAIEAQNRALELYGPDPALARERAQMLMHRASCLIQDKHVGGGLRCAADALDELPVEHHNALLYQVARQVLTFVPAAEQKRVEANDLRERLRALPGR